jgi:hypothetical protein
MRRVLVFLGLAVVVGMLSAATVAAASDEASAPVDIGLFYDELAPLGEWINHADYGWVWSPRIESEDWRPYTLGHWSWTDDYGWLWVSDEEFGWAVYHYGRWLDDEQYGWVWIPGLEWGPAWVAWREGEGYIGWAPLPPRARWDVDSGFGSREADFDEYIPEGHYSFVRDILFGESTVYNFLLPTSRSQSCYEATRNCTDYRPYHGRIVNRSVDVDRLRVITGHAVPRVRTVDVSSWRASHGHATGPNEIAVFRPQVVARPELRPSTSRSEETHSAREHPAHGHSGEAIESPPTETHPPAEAGSAERVVRRPGPAAGVHEEQVRALERKPQPQQSEGARPREPQREIPRPVQEHPSHESERVLSQPHAEHHGPSDTGHTGGSVSSTSSGSSSSSTSSTRSSSPSSSSSSSSGSQSKEKEKPREPEKAKRERQG